MFSINKKRVISLFSFIYILNCIDLLFTYTYIKLGGFYEVNPFIRSIIHDPYLSILVKVLLPAALLIYLFFKLGAIAAAEYKYYQFGIYLLLAVYLTIDGLHLYYLSFLRDY